MFSIKSVYIVSGTKYEQATVRTRRAQDCFLLAIPPISKTCAASFFERSFIYAAPTLWNQLSRHQNA